jgi:sugar lactone lactonase YvrE
MGVLLRRLAMATVPLALLAAGLRLRYGGGGRFPDRTTRPLLGPDRLEVVAELPWPPGNIAVSAEGRVFLSLHPESRPPIQVAELVGGELVPFPGERFQRKGGDPDAFDNVLGVRIDRQNRLWVLDNGTHGLRPGRVLAFDVDSRDLVHCYTFPRSVVGLGSHLNDLQVSHDGRYVLISDDGFIARKPALIVYDTVERRSRRLLDGHPSVVPEPFTPRVEGRPVTILGLISVRPGVDSIALDRAGEWVYFAPVTNRFMYRLRLADVLDESLSAEALAARVEAYAPKTMSDGITTDDDGNVYITDVEHSAITRITPTGSLETLIRDARLLRWPDGFSFGPDGWLYLTCSAIHLYLGRLPSSVARHGPYHVVRLRTGSRARPGH